MLRLIREIYAILTPAQRRKILLLQLLIIAKTLLEIASVASVAPFMVLVADLDVLAGKGKLATLYRYSGITDPMHFLAAMGLAAMLMLTTSSAISILAAKSLLSFSQDIGAELSIRLYRYYMHQPLLFHAQANSATLTKRIASEATRVTKSILTPLVHMNSSLVLVAGISIALCAVDPVAAAMGIAVLSAAYLGIYRLVRHRIDENGKRISKDGATHFRMMSEGFGGIREFLLRDSQQVFIERFARTARRLASGQAWNSAFAETPRYVVEMTAIGSLIGFVLYLVWLHDGREEIILPLLSVYGLAALKLLPAFQRVYSSFATIKGAVPTFDSLKPDLVASQRAASDDAAGSQDGRRIAPTRSIELRDVRFRFPGTARDVLKGASLSIRAGTMVGLAGSSGAGKSTLLDVLLGLIQPQQGEIRIDDAPLSPQDGPAWRRSVGFAPQSIYLTDASIAENIAFGIPMPRIDMAKVAAVASLAQLDEMLHRLPQGLMTRTGERGIQLSGGQRQRIGIARALYGDPDLLVLDEATSALDVVTENEILNAIAPAGSGRTALVVTHRLRTLRRCQTIFFLDDGRIVDQGSYDELVERNAAFRTLDMHS